MTALHCIHPLRALFALVDRRTRRGLAGLFALGVVAAGLEMVGIGLLLPLLTLAVAPGTGTGFAAVDALLARLPGEGAAERFVGLAAIVFAFYVVKNAALGGIMLAQKTFAYSAEARFTTRLFADTLARPYAFHTMRNSAETIRTLTRSARSVFVRVLIPAVEIGMEVLLSAAAIAVLLLVEPLAILIGGSVVTAVLAAFVLATHKPLGTWGQQAERGAAEVLRWVQHGLGAIREILVYGRREHFVAGYRRAAEELARIGTLSDLLPQLPRLFVEVVAAAGILSVLAVLVWRGDDVAASLPVMGVFVAAAFRVMPSLNRIAQRAQVIRHGMASLAVVLEDLRVAPAVHRPDDIAPLGLARGFRLDGVRVQFPGRAAAALEDVALTVRRGEAVGLVGPTGAGKSTLADVILGLVKPDRGRLIVDERDVTDDPAAWQRSLGFVPQAIFLLDDTIRRNVALGVPDHAIDPARLAAAIGQARLLDFVAELPQGLDTRVGEHGRMISGGQRQRIGIARALYNGPEVLVLDEATSALDQRTESEITEVIGTLHGAKTLLVIAHRLSTLRRCDRLAVLDRGRIVDQGSFDELADRCQSFRELLRHGEFGPSGIGSAAGVPSLAAGTGR